ncbi:MAG TPA: acyclic terpene utilization AtuA family protein [Gammaproteobacteria bacterium]|nr:acyclic terpene utilization AtuA family protein [Gammaproteobacteria bacterium]
MPEQDPRKLIIGNCSGFYGDRLEAARELIDGGPIDVLTGDYLAELTMAILFRKKSQKPSEGYVGTFLKQMEDVMGDCLERGIKVVSNAGGLNPAGMARALQGIAQRLGLSPKVAWIEGDDLMPRLDKLKQAGETFAHLDRGTPLDQSDLMPVTANAYLGCWGIKEALERDADIVVAPRVTDAAVAMGPAAWKFGWKRDDYDALAGALAAGHIIECGAQATGGNYSFFQEVPSYHGVGYPLAEMHPDGAFVITKHPGTGGLVSVGTVTAQLMYEIATPEYLNPDVTAHFDTIKIAQEGEDRVAVSGVRGSSPPVGHKVSMNTLGGHRNDMTVILTGLDIEEKARVVENTLFNSLGGKDQFQKVAVQLVRSDKADPPSNEEAFAQLRISVVAKDSNLVGRRFSAKLVELALANIPGFTLSGPPGGGSPYLAYWPAIVGADKIREIVHVRGETVEVEPSAILDLPKVEVPRIGPRKAQPPGGETLRVPLGRIFATRAGDKGGNANLGVWGRTPEAYAFLESFLTENKLAELLRDLAPYTIERYEFPNLNGVNFYIRGLLGEGVSASSRMDPQAKTLGEYLRARVIEAPRSLVPPEYLTA